MTKSLRNVHAWRTTTAEGERREVRAHLFGANWRFSSRVGRDGDWVEHPTPTLEDLEALREVLFQKYQRKHLAYEHLEALDRHIHTRRARAGQLRKLAEPGGQRASVQDPEESPSSVRRPAPPGDRTQGDRGAQ